MFSQVLNLNKENWADIQEDDNTIITTNAEGQRVVLNIFNSTNGTKMKYKRVFDVIQKTEYIPKRCLERKNNWQKFGIDLLEPSSPVYHKFRSTPFESPEVLVPGVLNGAAMLSNSETDVIGEIPTLEVNKKLMNELTRLMNAIQNQDFSNVNSSLNNIEMQEEENNVNDDKFGVRYFDDDKTIRVSDIPEYVTEQELEEIFERVGPIKRLFLVHNKETLVSRGLAFITYHDISTAEKAIKVFDGKGISGAIVKISWSRR